MAICTKCNKEYKDSLTYCPIDGELLLIGAMIGKYRIEEKLGEGGMGAVYRATHTLIGDTVAVKILQPRLSQGSDSEKHKERFIREGQIAWHFSHPNSVKVYDLGSTEKGLFYIVMEYVQGHSLRKELEDKGKFSPRKAVKLLEPISDALTEAHSKGVIHRDLKPDNIVLCKRERGNTEIKLLDLGIAKIVKEMAINKDVGRTLTQVDEILGTAGYMAPEQIKAEEDLMDLDNRADIYSLGIIVYELVTGKTPFLSGNRQQIFIEQITKPIKPLSEAMSDIPKAFSQVVMKALSKYPKDRYSTCKLFMDALKDSLPQTNEFESDLLACLKSLLKKQGEYNGETDFQDQTLNGKYIVEKILTKNLFSKSYLIYDSTKEIKGRLRVLPHCPPGLGRSIVKDVQDGHYFSHTNVSRPYDCMTSKTYLLNSKDGKSEYPLESRFLERSYIVTDHIQGCNLSELVEEYGRLSFAEVLQLLKPIAFILDQASKQGYIYLHLHTDSIILTLSKTGQVAIYLCYNFCKLETLNSVYVEADEHTYIEQRDIWYTSPEELLDPLRGISFQSSVYNLGIIFYELILGEHPFFSIKAKSYQYLIVNMMQSTPLLLDQVVPDVPKRFSKAVAKALSKNPEDRFLTCVDFIQELEMSLPKYLD